MDKGIRIAGVEYAAEVPGAGGFVIDLGGAHRMTFRMGWRAALTARQSAILELGRSADIEGEREVALKRYRTLHEELRLSGDSGESAQQVAGAISALDNLLVHPYRPVC